MPQSVSEDLSGRRSLTREPQAPPPEHLAQGPRALEACDRGHHRPSKLGERGLTQRHGRERRLQPTTVAASPVPPAPLGARHQEDGQAAEST